MAYMTDGVTRVESFDDAVAAMLSDIGEATPVEPDAALPADMDDPSVPADQAETDVEAAEIDQPDSDVEEFDFEEAEPEVPFDPSKLVVTDLDQPMFEVKVRGETETVSLNELLNGYQRNKDYTLGKQELAERQRELESQLTSQEKTNNELWKALQEDPAGTVAFLAKEVGLLTEADAVARLRTVEGVRFAPETEVEQLVAQRVEEAVNQHPTVQKAMADRVQSEVANQFTAIESTLGKPLSKAAKVKIIDFAVDHQITDLEIAFDAMRARQGIGSPERQAVEQTRPQKRTRSAQGQKATSTRKGQIVDFDKAAEMALAQLEDLNAV